MRLELNLDFERRFAPDEFFFGVAYAPYCEGGGLNTTHGPKNTDWRGRTLGQDADTRTGGASGSGRTTASTLSSRPRSA